MIDFGLGKLRLWSAAAACAGLLVTQAAGAHPAAFTLNDVMQVPYPYDMGAAPAGGAVAWVFDAKGCRNIWVADSSGRESAPDHRVYRGRRFRYWRTRVVAGYEVDRVYQGREAGGRGSDQRHGSPEGPKPREVWVVSTAGGAPHKVGAGHSASFSPDGSQVVFVDKKRVLAAAASGEGEARPLLVDPGSVAR